MDNRNKTSDTNTLPGELANVKEPMHPLWFVAIIPVWAYLLYLIVGAEGIRKFLIGNNSW